MKKYDYREAVKNDVRDYIKEEINLNEWKDNKEELEEKLNEILWTNDSVTGNGSGSYTFSTWKAEENLCHNLDLLEEALDEFGSDKGYLLKEAASCKKELIAIDKMDGTYEKGFYKIVRME